MDPLVLHVLTDKLVFVSCVPYRRGSLKRGVHAPASQVARS